MTPRFDNKVLARVTADRLAGRGETVERLYLRAVAGGQSGTIRVLGAPGTGTSEILRNVYDRLFRDQRFVLPFYFALRASDANARNTAARFSYEFLLQTIAFRRNEPQLIAASPDVCELEKLALLPDADWVKQYCEACDNAGPLNDDRAFIRTALAAPLRAAAKARTKICLIIDDLHNAAALDGGQTFIEQLAVSLGGVNGSVILASRRNFQIPVSADETVRINEPENRDAAQIFGAIANDAEVRVSETVRDLLAENFRGRPGMMKAIVASAREGDIEIQSYRDAAQVYVAELTGGRIGTYCDRFIDLADTTTKRNLIAALATADMAFSLDSLRARLGVDQSEFAPIANNLEAAEIIEITGDTASVTKDIVVRDYLRFRSGVDSRSSTNAAESSRLATEFLKRAPDLMARRYRGGSAVGLERILSLFDQQTVPKAVIDYRSFRDRMKGMPNDEIAVQLANETETVTLPQLVHVAPLSDHLSRTASEIDLERAVVGVGFTDRAYADADEIAWIAAEIDSKLEADPELTREWLDGLEAAARECGFRQYRIWLIAPEGFSNGALELLAERDAIGSSRKQVEFLRNAIGAGSGKAEDATEYEMVIPIGEDTELIAAHALEEIARRHDIPVKVVNQIKTALVEACINAAEHSLSPDNKIHQKFAVYDDKIVVTVSNRGIRLTDKMRTLSDAQPESPETRRGWGLNLIRTLMDDVRVESVDDGTRIVMTKNLPR